MWYKLSSTTWVTTYSFGKQWIIIILKIIFIGLIIFLCMYKSLQQNVVNFVKKSSLDFWKKSFKYCLYLYCNIFLLASCCILHMEQGEQLTFSHNSMVGFIPTSGNQIQKHLVYYQTVQPSQCKKYLHNLNSIHKIIIHNIIHIITSCFHISKQLAPSWYN